jgi:hypothetical protein
MAEPFSVLGATAAAAAAILYQEHLDLAQFVAAWWRWA